MKKASKQQQQRVEDGDEDEEEEERQQQHRSGLGMALDAVAPLAVAFIALTGQLPVASGWAQQGRVGQRSPTKAAGNKRTELLCHKLKDVFCTAAATASLILKTERERNIRELQEHRMRSLTFV